MTRIIPVLNLFQFQMEATRGKRTNKLNIVTMKNNLKHILNDFYSNGSLSPGYGAISKKHLFQKKREKKDSNKSLYSLLIILIV